jgi:hypothetical protein
MPPRPNLALPAGIILVGVMLCAALLAAAAFMATKRQTMTPSRRAEDTPWSLQPTVPTRAWTGNDPSLAPPTPMPPPNGPDESAALGAPVDINT